MAGSKYWNFDSILLHKQAGVTKRILRWRFIAEFIAKKVKQAG